MEANKNNTQVLELIRETVDNASAAKVFGAPVEHGDITVLPVAKVGGGGGGGSGTGPAADGHETSGTGGGLGITARALGVYVIKDGKVSWRPAIDVNKVIFGAQLVAIAALLTARALIGAPRKGGGK